MSVEKRLTIKNHRHCLVCGKPVSLNEEFCGDSCRLSYERKSRRRKLTDVVFIVLLIVFLILTFPL